MIVRTLVSKEEYKAISPCEDGYKILWDYKPVTDTQGSCCIMKFNYKPNLGMIKNVILNWFNDEINKKILSGFVWNGMKVWLSSENQFNYKAAYDLACQTNGATLPIVVKFGTSSEPIYYTFTNLEEFTEFYTASIKYIQSTLEEGWKQKDSINWEEYNV